MDGKLGIIIGLVAGTVLGVGGMSFAGKPASPVERPEIPGGLSSRNTLSAPQS